MAPASESSKSTTKLTADYNSPTSSKTFIHELPTSSPQSTKEKTAYLSALRRSVVGLQEEVNGFLTTKMEEDKATAARVGLKADDKKEEENYGEETVEDEG
ncbi:hypothetical protein MMC21_002443 [Puttea exsequens]|nr:hypothetical protein [Puttea exsequens]